MGGKNAIDDWFTFGATIEAAGADGIGGKAPIAGMGVGAGTAGMGGGASTIGAGAYTIGGGDAYTDGTGT